MPAIFVVGSSNTDMVVRSKSLPKPGETVLGGEFLLAHGGKGANQAVAAARLGGNVFFVAKVGNDVFGQNAIQQFQNEKIATQFVSQAPNTASGIALINVNEQGENCIAVAPGANQFLSKKEIEEAAASFTSSDWALVQLEIPLESVSATLELANAHQVKTVLNPAPAQELPSHFYEQLFAITPNETEAECLTGIKISSLDSAHEAAKSLLDFGVQHVVITLGSQGAYYLSKFENFHVPSPTVIAQDTTAAGDCFNGALVVALSEGKNWKDAITFACNAAALSVQKMGAQPSLPFRNQL